MKTIRLIFSILIPMLSAGTMRTFAQQSPVPTPKSPYVAPVPSYGHWTVELKSEAAAPPATAPGNPTPTSQPGIPTTIETIRTGDLKRVILTYSTGASRQFDQAGPYFLTSSGSRADLFIPHRGEDPYPFYTKGFLFFETISPSWFRDVVKIGGVDCFHYENGSTQLWVSVDSMLPVAAKSEGITAHYQFQPAPGSPIVLPPDEKAVLEKEMNAQKASQSVR